MSSPSTTAPPEVAAEPNALLRALLGDLKQDAGLDLTIDPDDEMLGFLLDSFQGDRDRAQWAYFQSGASIAAAMAQVLAWRFGDPASPGNPPRVGRLLDFASGYGRVTRFLTRLLPAERIWVADIYAAGVRFQERRFGVHGIVSTVLPEEFAGAVANAAVAEGAGAAALAGSRAGSPLAGAGFDAILVTSLFTHLPRQRFVAWLRVLMGLLAPGGVLAFSVHDRSLLAPGLELPPEGLLFQEISESGSLDTADYGSTWVSEDFVRQALEEAGGGSLFRAPRGLCNYQDLYVAVPEPQADFSRLDYRGEPRLFIEHCAMVPAPAGAPVRFALDVRGWAALTSSGAAEAVELALDDQVLGRLPVVHQRPDVADLLGDPRLARCGWGGILLLPASASRSASVLRFGVIDDRGYLHPESASTLEAALHASTRNDVTVVQLALHAAGSQLAAQAAEAAALRARISAMEASRFWKLRNLWFRLRRIVGRGGEL